MFNFFKKKAKKELGAPVAGTAVELSKVPDPTFSSEMLGKGIAVIPSDGKIVAPADGKIDSVFDTLHALSMTTADGMEVLIHIGLDTVTLKGGPFEAHVNSGDTVKKGDLLITADLNAIQAAGLNTITLMVVCNTDDFAEVSGIESKEVKAGEMVVSVQDK